MCTRVLWNTNDLAVLAGRSMDWPESTRPQMVAFAPGRERDGGVLAGEMLDENGLRWTSRYASVVTTVWNVGTADGFNEKGLAVHALYLKATSVGERDPSQPGLHTLIWVQYFLDQAATVGEAISLIDSYQLMMVGIPGADATVHLALEDATGDSAIIELLDGNPVVHHGREYRLMTNDPPYDEQLKLLAEQDFSHPTEDTPLPGNVSAVARFQRAAYFAALLPEPDTERTAVAAILAIMRNVSVPFGVPDQEFGVCSTEYRTVIDLTHLTYYFELTTSPNIVWADFSKLDLTGTTPLAIDLYEDTLVGDITARFAPADIAF